MTFPSSFSQPAKAPGARQLPRNTNEMDQITLVQLLPHILSTSPQRPVVQSFVEAPSHVPFTTNIHPPVGSRFNSLNDRMEFASQVAAMDLILSGLMEEDDDIFSELMDEEDGVFSEPMEEDDDDDDDDNDEEELRSE